MVEIFLKTLPFFGLIVLGFGATKSRFFSEEATGYLTKFVFYFALSAMLFRFSANLSLSQIFEPRLAAGYLLGTTVIWSLAMAVALWRRLDLETATIEAQVAVIGNTGFLGVPMLVLLLGPEAIGPVILALVIDLVVFSSLLVILITASRQGRPNLAMLKTVLLGLLKNPMIVSITAGLFWSATALPLPTPINAFLELLGNAATPGALFAIGASLAGKSAERLQIAVWLSFAKLFLHPLSVAIALYWVFQAEAFGAAVMISAAALPVAGNVFILAQHYGVAPQRVSASILISTVVSIVTVSAVIALVQG